MRRTLTALLFSSLACAPSRPPAPTPAPAPTPKAVLTRIGGAFVLSKDIYAPSDTFQYVMDGGKCEPRGAYLIWRREGDTLTAIRIERNDPHALTVDLQEPLNLEAGIQNYNISAAASSVGDVNALLRKLGTVCRQLDTEYQTKYGPPRT